VDFFRQRSSSFQYTLHHFDARLNMAANFGPMSFYGPQVVIIHKYKIGRKDTLLDLLA